MTPHYLSEFMDELLVVCPRCQKQAHLLSGGSLEPASDSKHHRLTCGHCGLVRDHLAIHPYDIGAEIRGLGVRLWLVDACCGELLWAMNQRHLEFLIDWIGRLQRPRPQNEQGFVNRSLESRLPQWLLEARHRQEVLACCESLKKRLLADRVG
ncbi:MAG: hypothetical protein ACKN9U_20740 [Pirellulaceae bacterium]